jgi:periplasmic protein CpxP/Spy
MKIKSIIISTIAIIAFSSLVYAQDAKPTDNQDSANQEKTAGKNKKNHKKHGKDMAMHSLEKLNLSDTQKEQLKNLKEQHKSKFQPLREEMKTLSSKKHDGIITTEEENRLKDLKSEMKTNGQKINEEMMNILTAEQKTQFEQMKAERRGKMKERRGNSVEPTAKPQEN